MSENELLNFLYAPLFTPLLLVIFFAATKIENSRIWYFAIAENIFTLLVHLFALLLSLDVIPGYDLNSVPVLALQWSDSWNLQFALNLKELNVIFLLSASLIFCVTSFISRPAMEEKPGRIYALLLLKCAVLGAFSTSSFFQFCFFSAAGAIPGAFILGFDDSEETKNISGRYLIVRWISSFILLVCFIFQHLDSMSIFGAVNLMESFKSIVDKPDLLIGGLMMFALLLQFLIFPFGSYLNGIQRSSRFELYLPLLTVGNLGTFGICQFVLPHYQIILEPYGILLLALGLVSFFWSLISLLSETGFRLRALRTIQFFGALVLMGIGSFTKWGLVGALLVDFSLVLVACSVYGIVSICERLNRLPSLNSVRDIRLLSLLFVLAILHCFAFPMSFSFNGIFFVMRALSESVGVYVFPIAAVTIPMFIIALYRMLFQKNVPVSTHSSLLNSGLLTREKLFCVPIILILIVLSVFPDLVTILMVSAVSNILEVLQGAAGV